MGKVSSTSVRVCHHKRGQKLWAGDRIGWGQQHCEEGSNNEQRTATLSRKQQHKEDGKSALHGGSSTGWLKAELGGNYSTG